MMKQPIRFKVAALFVALSASLGIWLVASPSFADDSLRLPSVSVSKVQRGEIVDRVPISGTLIAKDEVLVFPLVSGYSIEKIHYEIGETVRHGDVLAELNRQTLRAQLAQAQAEFARAQAAVRQAMSQVNSSQAAVAQADAALDRSNQLRKSGTATQAALDQAVASAQTANANLTSVTDGVGVAEAQRQQAEAQLEIARVNFEHATIVAPVDGLISARNVQIGTIATSSGEPNFRIITDGIVEVKAEILETALGDVKVGNPVELDIAGIGQVSGSIRLISPTVDPISRLGMVRISINDTIPLRTGLFASGWLITDERISLTVPNRAVLSDAKGNYVLAVNNDGIVERKSVTAGSIWAEQREIISGVEIDQTLISKAGAFFADGDKIKPVFGTKTQSAGDE